MEKTKRYPNTFFPDDIVKRALERLEQHATSAGVPGLTSRMSITHGAVAWDYDTPEEFFADYRHDATEARLNRFTTGFALCITCLLHSTIVSVRSESRSQIEGVFQVFEEVAESCRRPSEDVTAEKPVIFLGHGRNPQWRDLKDHLTDKHGYSVQAYEVGSRAGHAVRDVLEDMMTRSSMAFLILTAEDETASGTYHARQNVIHETGLFQGRLGFSRAIVLLEDGTEEFSNLAGIEQIRFKAGRIRETFGDVLAAIKREFAEST